MAVELAEAAAAELARVSQQLRARVEAVAPRARLTWIAADRLHFTIRFLGEVDDARAAAITAALAPPLAAAAFDITMTEVGAFPPKGPPRVLWAGVGEGRGQMVALEREVSARLASCGVPPEPHSYTPHVTLARVREANRLRTRDVLDAAPDGVFGVTGVDAITLFQSRLSPNGPTYVALQRTALGRT